MGNIRDPVHRWIPFNSDEKRIIDSPLFQRLRYVSQLTSVDAVFPGGDHSRFIHSLGVMHLSGLYMTHLLKDLEGISDWSKNHYIQLARIAGLLHDIGHGPFSHAFDWSIYKQIYNVDDGGHDYHRCFIVKSNLLGFELEQCCVSPESLIAVWNPESKEYQSLDDEIKNMYDIVHAVVQGPLGADRMDFTLRDSYFTGITHLGTIAYDRIISASSIVERDGHWRLHYNTKCMSDIIQALDGRFRMYESIYLHKTVCAAGILISKMMEYAAPELHLLDKTYDLNRFQWLNEYSVVGDIINYADSKPFMSWSPGMKMAITYCRQWLLRKLPKLKEEHQILSTEVYDESKYAVGEDEVIVKTRSISGIDSTKFMKAKIYFRSIIDLNQKPVSITCEEALEKIKYGASQDPFYLVRIYKMPPIEENTPDSNTN
jgi:HD superfamily phosphohydrolase